MSKTNDWMYTRSGIRTEIQELFTEVSVRNGLQSGDMSMTDQTKIDVIVEELERLLIKYRDSNK